MSKKNKKHEKRAKTAMKAPRGKVQALPQLIGKPGELNEATISYGLQESEFGLMSGRAFTVDEEEAFAGGMRWTLAQLEPTGAQWEGFSADRFRFSIGAYARAQHVRERDALRSCRRLLEHVPALLAHVEFEPGRCWSPVSGEIFPDYRLDTVGYLVWLYWRNVNGRLPVGIKRREEDEKQA